MRQNTLEYRHRAGDDATQPLILALHGEAADHRQLLPLIAQASPRRGVMAPKSGRWSSWTADRQRYSWFQSLSLPAVEPIGFGDSLWQLEGFILDVVQGHLCSAASTAKSVDIVSFGQGAVLGLALAAVWPELFGRVIAIEGYWPQVKGWRPPLRAMQDVAVTLILDPAGDVDHVLADATAREMTARGASVETCWVDGAVDLDVASLSAPLAAQLAHAAQDGRWAILEEEME
jgi:predicted esterase